MKRSFVRLQRFRNPRIFWFLIMAITWGGLVLSLPGYYLWYIEQPIRQHFTSQQIILVLISGVMSFLGVIVSLGLGTFVFLRKPGDRGAVFVSYYLLIYGFIMSGSLEMVQYWLFHDSGGFSARAQAVIFTPMSLLLLLVFPNGKITPTWLRWLVPPNILISLLLIALPLRDINSISSWRSQVIYSIIGISFLLAMVGQVYRYFWKSSSVERQQTKIFLYGTVLQFVFLGISSVTYLQMPEDLQGKLLPEQLLNNLAWVLALIVIPIALTLAVIRSHLWDIDIVIRRTLVYGFLTGTLAILYFCSVVLMQYLFRVMAGHESPLAIVISTLTIAALFSPLRGRIQAIIDMRFYRSKYNSEQALARFQKSVRVRADLDQVEQDLTSIVQVTVQPEWMTMWIRKPEKE